MPRKPALTFAGALRILGRHDSDVVGRLDKALGGAVLGAGVAAAVGPAGLLAALWGWVDQKNEAIGLLRALVGSLSDRLAGVKRLERRDAIVAAHSTIVVAAFFEVLEETLGRRPTQALAVTDAERHVLAVGERRRTDQGYYEALYRSEIPVPSPSCGFHENLERVSHWLGAMGRRSNDFFNGLEGGPALGGVFSAAFQAHATSRYESLYLRLAEKVPEFAFWALLGENAATRDRVERLDASLRDALDVQGQALARVEALLSLVRDPSVELDRHRAGLHKANTGVLSRFVVSNDVERDADITFPTIERAFVTPNYRIAVRDAEARPADEGWWSDRQVQRDLELTLAAYLTSAEATTRPLLLLGHPGAGKSILMKVLAARLPPEDYTVVRVPLRAVGAGAPVVDQIQQALDIATNKRRTWDALTDQDADTVLVVLLDGLDELLQAAASDRGGYLQEVMEFQRIEGEQNRPVAVVVTSRTVVADRVDIPEGAPVVKLEEFDRDQIAAWLAEWRAANLPAIEAGVVRGLTADEALHQPHLAGQPLLLLMLALYAADPASPKLDADLSRAALYERIFERFARREVVKRAGDRLRPRELRDRVDEQLFRLSVAALAMVNRGVQHVREAALRKDLAELTQQDDLPEDEGARLLGEFFFVHAPEAVARERQRSYEFLHATFGEYLVARHVVGELAAPASTAHHGHRSRELDDEMLFALLSHQVWMTRAYLVDFAVQVFAALPPDRRDEVRRALAELLRTFRRRRRSTRLDRYRPTPLDVVRQLAVYSANLTTLAVRFTADRTALRLVGAFGDDGTEALANWRSTLSLWRAGLDDDSRQALVVNLDLREGSALDIGVKSPGMVELWSARLGDEGDHAARLFWGLAMHDRRIAYDAISWADESLAWIVLVLVHGEHGNPAYVVDPPEGTSSSDLSRVGQALSMLLRVRAWTLSKTFVLRAAHSLASYPHSFGVSAVTVLGIAYVHPEVLLGIPEWQDPTFYDGLRDELRLVLDAAGVRVDRKKHPGWDELRAGLLGDDDRVEPPTGDLANLFSRFD